jgi:hypothetical protein
MSHLLFESNLLEFVQCLATYIAHSITESSSSTFLKCCVNLQADNDSRLHYITSRLVKSLKFMYSSIYDFNVLVLTVYCKLINFVFIYFFLSVLKCLLALCLR